MTSPAPTTMWATLPFARSSVYSHRTVRSKCGCHRYQTTTSCPTWAECLRDGNGPDRPLDSVIIQFDPPILEEADEAFPVVESVADGLDRIGASGQLGQHFLEPGQHIRDDRSGFGLADRQPVFGTGTSDTSLDLVEAGDPPQRLIGDRGVAALGIVEEATPDMALMPSLT